MTVAAYIIGGLALACAGMVLLGAYLGHELRKRGKAYQLYV